MSVSEAIVLAILVPIAGALSTLIIKFWESVSGRRKAKHDEGMSYRDELRKDLDRKTNENNELREENKWYKQREDALEYEVSKWTRYYFDMYTKFYSLRMVLTSRGGADAKLVADLGQAPHEREAVDGTD